MLSKLISFFLGYRKLTFKKEDATNIINVMMQNYIDWWGFKSLPEGDVSFELLSRDYKKLRNICEDKIGILSEKWLGFPEILYRHRHRAGILVGIATFVFLLRLSGLFVWNITLRGNDTVSDTEITDRLEELGFSIGTYIPSVDFHKLCNDYMLDPRGISWISVNIKGTTATVEVIEKATAEIGDDNNGSPSNLIASTDGVIIRTEIKEGQLMVSPDMTVKKGDILVSGILETGREHTGTFILVNSSGNVYAETVHVIDIEVPFDYERKVPVGTVDIEKSLKIFGKNIKVYKNSGILPAYYDKISSEKRVVLLPGVPVIGDIALPIYLNSEKATVYDFVTDHITEKKAEEIALLRLTERAEEELPDAEILSRNLSFRIDDHDGKKIYVLRAEIRCIENIAEERIIGLR